jgi:hypothetical protein
MKKKLTKAEFLELATKNEKQKQKRKRIEQAESDSMNYEMKYKGYYITRNNGTWG